MLIKQKGRIKTPWDRLNSTPLTLNFLNINEKGQQQLRDNELYKKTC